MNAHRVYVNPHTHIYNFTKFTFKKTDILQKLHFKNMSTMSTSKVAYSFHSSDQWVIGMHVLVQKIILRPLEEQANTISK